ncbi:MAG TPA: T9SS type A sorting domain-containing protein [Bacteroidia bacterium]|nr:T9SS type A sorting domain-containing protein [Bacteroidia bacterium]
MKKIALLVSSFLFLVSCSFGQEIEWQNTIGGSLNDWLYSVQQTTDGGYILGGHSGSNISGDKTENSIGGTSWDYWVIKTDASGNIQWQNTIGGNDIDILYSIQQTNDGGYILGGYSVSNISGDKTENSIGGADYWIVKTDASGNILWQNTIGGNGDDWLNCVKQTTDGGYILAGHSVSGSSGDKSEINMGGDDYWIVKTDASGNIQWENTIGGNISDAIYSIQQTADGGYILGGWSTSGISGDKTENSNGGADYWIVKTDASGNIQWQNTIGGLGLDALYSIEQTNDGGYILGGYSWSTISGDKTENCIGVDDYWIVKTDASGNIQWQNTIGGNQQDELYSIQQTSDGGYILGGLSSSNISGDKTENSNGGLDYWIVKTDSVGNTQWQNSIGGSDRDAFRSIQQTANGGYILCGWSRSNISGDKMESSIGFDDYWIVKLTDNFNSITGKLFFDANSNAIQDAGEPAVANKTVTEINTGRFGFSQNTGVYYVNVLDSGNFIISPDALNYYNLIPPNHSVYFSGIQQTDSLNDFAFQPTGVFNDLCVTITPMGNFRANMNASYMINYENVGTTTLNGTVIFFPDNDVTFVSSNVTPTSVTTDSVVWNVGTLTPFQTGSILVTVHVIPGTPIGTLINSSVVIEPVTGDANTACNYNSWEVFVTGAVDPNAILVDRDTILTTELSSPPYLNYIIYFQNTGNDTAFNVKVLNPIDTNKLDIHSFEFVSSSHPVNIEYKIWERNLHFTFDNILLPDSNVNEPASHGFIRYRIKPLSTLVAGDSIKNKAAIYFDFNPPVLTDTVVTEIVLPTGVSSQWSVVSGQLIVYPNPAGEELIVNSYSVMGKEAGIKIYDLFGREVFQLQTSNFKLQTKIDVSRFSQGIYFVEVQSGEKILRGKFLKQ